MRGSGPANADALVGPDWLEENLLDPDLRVVEITRIPTDIGRPAIPATTWWYIDPFEGGSCLSRRALSVLLHSSGVDESSIVVLYSGEFNELAALAYWNCKLRGFDRVKLLDGGRRRWEIEGRELADPSEPAVAPRYKLSGTVRSQIRAGYDDIVLSSDVAIVDVRSRPEFAGRQPAPDAVPNARALPRGRIPGAMNVPFDRTVNIDGSFKGRDELRQLFRVHGVTWDYEIIAYCLAGERSAHTWFVLAEILGFPWVKNYDGSWMDYAAQPGALVERG